MARLITLLTDFGTADTYVAQMKGVIYSLAPSVTVVDITHDIAPQDILGGARALLETAPLFPPGTIHVAVVDPGVGTKRTILCVEACEQTFILPDNGLISLLLQRYPATAIYAVENEQWFRNSVSSTFHGRDVMAPVAARIAIGLNVAQVGGPMRHICELEVPQATWEETCCTGQILSIDRFGNLITNIPAAMFTSHLATDTLELRCGDSLYLVRRVQTYGDTDHGHLVALVGSQGWLEISVANGSAAERTKLTRGAVVSLQSTTHH